MKLWSDFLELVSIEVPGCPTFTQELAVKNTVIEFCERSLIHQVTLDPITLMPNVSTYDLDTPGDTRVAKIMKAFYKGQELQPVAPDSIVAPDPYEESVTQIPGYTPTKAPPRAYTQRDTETVTFIQIPDQRYPNAVTIRAALVPLRSATGCEDFLYELYAEDIAAGAKARLQLDPGKVYTNAAAAQVNQARYIAGLNEARQQAVRGFVRSGLQVRLRKP